jgi:hypothetical protein
MEILLSNMEIAMYADSTIWTLQWRFYLVIWSFQRMKILLYGDSNVWRFYLVIWRFQCMEILLSNMEIPMYGDST